jgi:hypothetical protein
MTQDDFEKKIRRQIEKKYDERQGLLIHAAAFVVFNILIWGIYLMVGPAEIEFPFPIFVTGGWGIGMLGHAMTYYNRYGGGARRKEAAIQAEIQRYKEEIGYYEKPKRQHLELNDDGEIDSVMEEETRSERRGR